MSTSTADLPSPARKVVHEAEREMDRTEVPRARHLRLLAIVRLTLRQTGPHHLSAFAGNLAFNAFIASFPFLLLVLSILRAVHATGLVSSLVDLLGTSLPASSAQLFRDQIQPDVLSRIPDAWLLNVFLAAGSLWAASAVFRAVTTAMNVMYEEEETRPLWIRFGLSFVLSLIAACLFLVEVVLILAGSRFASAAAQTLHLGGSYTLISNAVQWAVLIGVAFLGFVLIYYCAPDVRRPFRSISPGAVSATAAWLLFSLGFSVVLNRFGAFLVDPLYGWFTGLIVLLLYLYWSSLILLVGAEINHVIEANGRGPGDGELPTGATAGSDL